MAEYPNVKAVVAIKIPLHHESDTEAKDLEEDKMEELVNQSSKD